jgi:hypothetical protein
MRKVRQSLRPRSQATRYQRLPVWTTPCGSTVRRLCPPFASHIVEVQAQLVATGTGEIGQQAGIDAGPDRIEGVHGRAQRIGALAQAHRHQLFELDHGAAARAPRCR